jgi:SAM-dependent methyltransferase
VDIDKENVQIAQRRGIDARECDLNRSPLPFENQAFDLIFAGEVIEHLVDTDGFLSELHGCVRPGGSVLITTHNLVYFENHFRILLGLYPIWVNYSLRGSGHVRAYTPRVLKKQLFEHGFEFVTHKGNWVPFIPQSILNDLTFPPLGPHGRLISQSLNGYYHAGAAQ